LCRPYCKAPLEEWIEAARWLVYLAVYIQAVGKIKGIQEIEGGPDKAKGGHPRYLAILSVTNPVSMGSFRRQISAVISLCVSAQHARV
jgi:hypothetical protein